jgi:hypothetical protein
MIGASAYGRILNVPSQYPTIQAGIDAALNGDTVLVAPGTYVADTIVIQDKNILLTSAEGPSATEIRGCIWIRGASVDTTCVLRGFRLNGQGVTSLADNLVWVEYGSPIVWGNVIENNNTGFGGAGIWAYESGAVIRGNIVRNNSCCAYGGGILVEQVYPPDSRSVTIEGNVVADNYSGWCINDQGDGGGIWMLSSGTVRYNLIVGNRAYKPAYRARGGGLGALGTNLLVHHNTFAGNYAWGAPPSGEGWGGGLYFAPHDAGGLGDFRDNIVAFNPAGGGAWAQLWDTTHVLVWDYNLVFDNSSADYIGLTPGPHDIQADPLFVNRFSGDYRLLPNSPCIDAGDPIMPLDPDSTRADIGAYFFDQSVGIEGDDVPLSPFRFTLRQNYPNPFNGQTVISFCLTEKATVSLHIYSIAGHLVKSLVNKETQETGEHTYSWEGRDSKGKTVSTGVYFYELFVNNYKESKAMILIK